MLRNVLGDYLDRLPRERSFDAPFQALLGAMGFYDIHFTHGGNEMGKDFIAKRDVEGSVQQWTFQTKRGDISLSEWRKHILGQMLTCESTGLQHPNFDASLPRQSVLVTTGVVGEHANNEIDSFSKATLIPIGKQPVLVWGKPVLVDLLVEHGLGALQATLAGGTERFGPFYTLLGRSISGELVLEDLELYSRAWLSLEPTSEQVLLAGSVEAAVLADQCRTTMSGYEAIYAELAALRTLCWHWYRNEDEGKEEYFAQLIIAQKMQLISSCSQYCTSVLDAREQNEGHLDRAINSPALIVTYPVICMRMLEALSLSFFVLEEGEARRQVADTIEDLVQNEPGATHPISDRYAVSVVLAFLALRAANRHEAAKRLLVDTAIFVGDRYEHGFGLASVDATVDEEIQQILGYPFEAFKVSKETSSLLATALGDMAALYGDPQLYSDVVNEFKACRIYPHYWQCQDTVGQFELDAEDVIQYSSTEFDDDLSPFDEFRYSQHMVTEPRHHRLADKAGFSTYAGIALLLRDRYFPSLWQSAVAPHAS